ncbi:MAG: hypothetical protein GXY44_16615 [Phycisphaerales bacterium]|nr:hypothetical protein [Phycisphaerales bacterium]
MHEFLGKLAIFLVWTWSLVVVRPTGAEERVRLVFTVDQGFGNGLVINRDVEAMQRIAVALKSLEPAYAVYALFQPQVADRDLLDTMLDICVRSDLPFVFDVYSSEAMTLGTSTPHNAPADGPNGVAISIEDLTRYKHRYGRWLAGVRIMEVFSQDYTVQGIRTNHPEWKGENWVMPPGDFFRPEIARLFLAFAREHGLFLHFTDWHWHRFGSWDKRQRGREDALRELLREFPDRVTVVYANNEPQEKAADRLGHWQEAVQPFIADGARGFGLSAQAWLREPEMLCPVEDVISWMRSALALDCRVVQFEPAWYFFQLPRGTFYRGDYTGDPRWLDRGQPTPAFHALRRALLDASSTTAEMITMSGIGG